jgi:D-alanyl-D-alanine carboxypeptidase
MKSSAHPEARLATLVERTAAGELIPDVRACLLRVESPALQPAWAGAAGSCDAAGRRPLVPTDSFRIASVTKMMTATTLLQLVDDEAVQLDEPALDHLAADTAVLLSPWQPSVSQVTLRQLLDHTSGLPDYFIHDRIGAAMFGESDGPFTPTDLLCLAAESPLAFHPGNGRQYSDTGFVLAGLIIEAVTGLPLQRAFRTQLFDPLGMDDSSLLEPTLDWAGGGLL